MADDPSFVRFVRDPKTQEQIRAAADLPTSRARNNLPTLAVAGVWLHSRVDPLAEAATQARSCAEALQSTLAKDDRRPVCCLIAGPGLGYILKALYDLLPRPPKRDFRILCVEWDAVVARKALLLRVWEPFPCDVQWLVQPEPETLRSCLGDDEPFPVLITAGYRLHKADYDDLLGALKERRPPERPLRILVPTPLYGGSLPIALHCADAFRRLGHTVELFDLSPFYSFFQQAETATRDVHHRKVLQGLCTTYLAELIAARALDWRADLVWALAQTPLTPNALQELRHEGVHSALWFVEDFRLFNYWRELAPHYDAVFTIQRGPFHDELRALGLRHVCYLPCAANPHVHRPFDLAPDERARYGADVSFVGAGYRNRQHVFQRLALPGLKIWGNDWPPDSPVARLVQENGRRVSTEETALIFNATRINLNLHSSAHHEDVNPHGDFVNPRTFEIAACGAFQLTDERSELASLFDIGTELITFRRADDLPALVRYYLEHEEERRAIAHRARQRVLREHTYEHRMATAISFLESKFRRLAERKRGPNYVSALKAAVADDPELVAFLSAFPEDEEIDLDHIVSRISLGKGELTRAEGIFLLMKEFRDWGREKGVIQ